MAVEVKSNPTAAGVAPQAGAPNGAANGAIASAASGAANPLEELIQAAMGRTQRPKPWVDVISFPWVEEEFSSRYVRRVNYQEQYGMKETGEEVDELMALLSIRAKNRVLDLCSGNGRHAIALALRGCKMTGVDIGPGPVALARETSRNLGLSVDYRQIDALSISFEDAYDAAYLTCAGLSDFSSAAAIDLLTRIGRALVPEGLLAVEFLDAASADTSDPARSWRFVSKESSLFIDGAHLQLDERFFDKDAKAEVVRSYVVPENAAMRQFARCRQYWTEEDVRGLLSAASLQIVRFAAGSGPGVKKVVAKKT
jgi:ubiquinone/menaquinone biosynthesis C-methylase UbiE